MGFLKPGGARSRPPHLKSRAVRLLGRADRALGQHLHHGTTLHLHFNAAGDLDADEAVAHLRHPAQQATGGAESTLYSLLPLVLMFVVLYFIMIRPQMKKQKEHKAMIEAITKGDEVVVAGGLLGRVAKMGDSFISVEVANGVEVQVQRGAVAQVLPKGTVSTFK